MSLSLICTLNNAVVVLIPFYNRVESFGVQKVSCWKDLLHQSLALCEETQPIHQQHSQQRACHTQTGYHAAQMGELVCLKSTEQRQKMIVAMLFQMCTRSLGLHALP